MASIDLGRGQEETGFQILVVLSCNLLSCLCLQLERLQELELERLVKQLCTLAPASALSLEDD